MGLITGNDLDLVLLWSLNVNKVPDCITMLFIVSLVGEVYIYESFQHLSDCMMEDVAAMLNAV